LLLQAASLSIEQSPAKRFTLTVFGFVASGLPILVSLEHLGDLGNENVLKSVFSILQIVAAIIRGLGCLLIPRRPDVYRGGKLVSREQTVSLLTKHTFGWATEQLLNASSGAAFEPDSLPRLSSLYRSQNQAARLEKTLAVQGTLRDALFRIYKAPLILQALLVALSSALESAPQVALYMALKSLEKQQAGEPGQQPWIWVLALGASKILTPALSSWVKWMNQGGLCIPLNAGLTSVIFSKALRRKDVKHGTDDQSKKKSGDDHKQDIINLISVDLDTIDGFVGYTYLIPASFLKLIFALTFLTQLIGWKSLLSAVAMSLLLIPINSQLINKYGSLQKGLVKSRDQRMAVIREAIHGIRYIKFAALEEYWKTRIFNKREDELSQIRSTFFYNALLFSMFWIISPLALSSVSLAMYTLEYGSSSLTASVAFTTVSVLDSLELSLAILPEFFTQGVQANLSSSRIDQYLKTAEKTPIASAGSQIEFADATISWPTEEAESDFVLRNVNLKFPYNKLSVISGKTGSGKSLLLAAILGECELIGGYIKTPFHDPKLDPKLDADDDNISDWIIPSATVYVGQIPWIENASIKENILFSLPYQKARYKNVLEVCALLPDLATLSDGDSTEVGPNGVNLSGGQRWRVSFARALYSRAGILVLDDIFSALDAHTGRYVYENALTGHLAKDRTRILATHQVFPRIDYLVHVENGTAKAVGQDHTTYLASAQSQPTISKGLKLEAHLTETKEKASKENNPRKFVTDEEKQTGHTKLSVYAAYLSKGGVLSWTLVFVLYASYTSLILGRVSTWVIYDFIIFTMITDFSSHGGLSYGLAVLLLHYPSELLIPETKIPQSRHIY
jgi:ABC-type multidrug transport system fused ATPase/permease subunit